MALPEASMEITTQAFAKANEDDKKLHVRFSMRPRLNTEKSAAAGRPIYEDKEFIMIMVPGDATSIVERPVWGPDRERFPFQYQAFKNNQDQASAAGTPLTAVTFLSGAQIRELEYFNCRTVEHLASMQDAHASKFPGIQDLKQKAQKYLLAAQADAPLTQMKSELDKRDEQIAAMQAQINELLASREEAA